MVIMEGMAASTISEPKQDNEQKDSSTELPRAFTDMETSVAHDPDTQKLIGHEADTELTPYEGMEFESEDAARDFYSKYARNAGFRIRISRYTRSRRDNSIISRRIVCSKEGFHETRDCESLHADQKQQARVGSRVGCKAMLMIKKFGPDKWVVTKFVKNHNHGPVPPRKFHAGEHHDSDLMENPHSIEVDSIDEPVEGMEFESEEAAKLFYINYATVNGFRARISRYCRSRRDNSIISRQIVCSKEGFREVRARKDITDGGKTTKRPRMITRVGCKAMIVVKKMNSGKWMVSKFEKEHNHSLLSSRAVPNTSTVASIKVADYAATSTDTNEVKVEGYSAGIQCNSTDSLTVLYNHLCQEAIKFAKEGSVTEEIYHVAMNALKEAAEKVSEVKKSHPTMSQGRYSINESKHDVTQMKTMSALQFSNEDEQKNITSQIKLFQDPSSSLVLIPTNLLTHSGSNCADNIPLSCDLTIKGEVRHESESTYLSENRKENSFSKSQNSTCNQALQGKDERFHGLSEETTVAIPAIPLTLYMPIMKNPPGDSADGTYRLLAAPIEAVPISYRPAEPIQQPPRSFPKLGPLPGFLPKPNKHWKGPNSLVHATALACGARVVPPEEAASLIKAIESKIRSGGATIAKLPSSSLTPLIPEVTSMSSSSEDDEENDHNELLMESIERNCHDQSSEEMKLQADPS